jgi:phosphoribosylpyrophosphate synthetase
MEPEVEATAEKIFFSPDQCEYTDLKIFSLNADDLGHEITAHLDIALGRIESRQFADGEISLQILDSVSGHKVFIIKSFAGQKINDGIMELILAVSSMKKSGASNITVIVPYFPYSKVESSLHLTQPARRIPRPRPSSQPTSPSSLRQWVAIFW